MLPKKLELAFIHPSHNKRESSADFKFLEHRKLVLPSSDQIRIINFDMIRYLKADGNYTKIFLTDGSYVLIAKTMKYLYNKLDESFIRVHQSYAVNLLSISAFNIKKSCICMIDGDEIPVSRSHRANLKSTLLN